MGKSDGQVQGGSLDRAVTLARHAADMGDYHLAYFTLENAMNQRKRPIEVNCRVLHVDGVRQGTVEKVIPAGRGALPSARVMWDDGSISETELGYIERIGAHTAT